MTSRILPVEEWPRLAGTELEAVWPVLDPQQAHIVVVEHDGAIVGCWAVIRYVHVEGVWIAPSYRKRGRVAAHLLRGMRSVARAMGAEAVWTAAVSDEVEGLIGHLGGVRLPADHYVMPVGGA